MSAELTTVTNNLAKFKAERDIAALKSKYPIPTDIAVGEEGLKALRKTLKEWKDKRIAFIEPINTFLDQLAAPEKELTKFGEEYGKALLNLKATAQEAAEAAQRAAELLAAKKAAILRDFNAYQADCEQLILNRVNELYNKALEHNLTADEATMNKLRGRLLPTELTPALGNEPDPELAKYKSEIWAQHNPSAYIAKFHQQLTERFIGFENDKLHKSEALAVAEHEKVIAEQEIAQKAQIDEMMVRLSTVATAQPQIDFKPLKKAYVVKMEPTPQNMALIDAAFVAQNGYASGLIRVKSLFNITQQQKADYLGALKSKDNALSISGIIFEEVKKL